MAEQKILEIVRIFHAPAEDVFDAWTDPKIMAEWFFAHPTWSVDVEADVRVGGLYRLTMKAPDGTEFETHGEYREIEAPRRLVFTWNSYIVTGTLVTVEIRADGDKSELHLTHTKLDDEAVRKRHADGWAGCLDSLERHFAPSRNRK